MLLSNLISCENVPPVLFFFFFSWYSITQLFQSFFFVCLFFLPLPRVADVKFKMSSEHFFFLFTVQFKASSNHCMYIFITSLLFGNRAVDDSLFGNVLPPLGFPPHLNKILIWQFYFLGCGIWSWHLPDTCVSLEAVRRTKRWLRLHADQ